MSMNSGKASGKTVNTLLKEVDENAAVDRIALNLPRASTVINAPHQSDAEILDVGLANHYLAVTTDSIAEEIQTGLYRDPRLMGWMAVVANLSDLAAAGATAQGMLITMTVSPEWDEAYVRQVTDGMAAALAAHECGSLGGDMNTGAPVLGGTAVGLVEKKRLMQRTGISDGDYIYATGPVGMGGAYAFARLFGDENLSGSIDYQPVARLAEARHIAPYATACMDTSDGIIATLDQLFRLNQAVFHLEEMDVMAHPAVCALAESSGLPLLCFLAAIHGEFELCFTVSEAENDAFLAQAAAFGLTPVFLGRATTGPAPSQCGLFVKGCRLPSGEIRNLWTRTDSAESYLTELRQVVASFTSTLLSKGDIS